MKLTCPKAILFDWDATLADTYALVEAAHNHVHQALGLPIKPDGWLKSEFGLTRHETYQKFYARADEEIDALFINYLIERHLEHTQPMDGAKDVLDLIKLMRIPCAVVTNKRRSLAEPEIKTFGWQDYFQTVICADEAPHNKPHPAPLSRALEQLNYQGLPQDVWLVGDSASDWGAAKALGTQFIYYNAEKAVSFDMSAHSPAFIFDKYKLLHEKLIKSQK